MRRRAFYFVCGCFFTHDCGRSTSSAAIFILRNVFGILVGHLEVVVVWFGKQVSGGKIKLYCKNVSRALVLKGANLCETGEPPGNECTTKPAPVPFTF